MKPRYTALVTASALALALAGCTNQPVEQAGPSNTVSTVGASSPEPDVTIGDIENADLDSYRPFGRETRALTADSPLRPTLQGDLPRLDGATALYPLYASFVRSSYPEGAYPPYSEPTPDGPVPAGEADWYSDVVCTRTISAFQNLVTGKVEIAFLLGVSNEQAQLASKLNVELEMIPIGYDAFVFMVNDQNPVETLTLEQIRDIYTGKITNWSQVGGEDLAIEPFQRQPDSGSQTAFLEMMGSAVTIRPPMTEENSMTSMSGMMERIADYTNHRGAIGYSFRYYIRDMMNGSGVKLLAIDDVEPTLESIKDLTYQQISTIFAVRVVPSNASGQGSKRAQNSQRLIDWILSPDGQGLVEEVGYMPLGSLGDYYR
ncbi:MAG: substrate-binding domain-containing protein [Bifidobacteriaceae bacterium]|jgi:phosphate transport system substrate-binding protein|nr:substrate-binding domain-containing protein [Bifidobacteriaceae bacterium]